MANWFLLFLFALVALGLNLLFTPLILKTAKKRDWLDQPNHRTVHKDPVPRLGGVGMFAAMAIVLIGAFVADRLGWLVWPAETWTWTALLLGIGWASTHILGVLDDFVEFRAIYKLLLQLFGVFIAIGAGLNIDRIEIPLTTWVLQLGLFGPFVTLLWVVGITNAVNLIDGMDGQAGGYSFLALGVLGLYSALVGNWLPALVCFTAAGVLFAFLIFNFPPAKIFMGDSGSLMLGYLLAVVPLMGGEASLFHHYWLLPAVLVLIPLADTIAAILRRLRAGRPVWSPDKFHMHHKLLALGLSTRTILAIVYSTTLLTAIPVFIAGVLNHYYQHEEVAWWGSLASGILVLVLFSVLHTVYHKRIKP